MNGTSLRAGDRVCATVTRKLPVGLIVESTTGVFGLVRRADAEVGDVIDVRVDEYDPEQRRFSGHAV